MSAALDIIEGLEKNLEGIIMSSYKASSCNKNSRTFMIRKESERVIDA